MKVSESIPPPGYALRQLVGYMLKLGSIGFGGPVALVGYMHRDLVEERRWISEREYREGLALAQLMPGPLAAQLAIYLGYLHYRYRGATLAGVAFVLPSFLMVVALGWLYLRFGGLSWIAAAFYGVGASVIGIIAMSAYKLAVKNLGSAWQLWGIFLICAGVTAVTRSESVWLFLLAGIGIWLTSAPPRFLSRGKVMSVAIGILPAAPALSINWQLLTFFAKAGTFVFGSGLAIVPFLYGGVVTDHHWLTDRQFTDAVAVAMITPGPVVITVGFIGFLVAGIPGAIAAAVGTFLPCYVFTVLPAPYFRRYGKHPGVIAFISGATAAAIGTIAGSVVVLGRRSIVDVPTALLALATVAVLLRFKKLPEPLLIAAAAVLGLLLYPHAAHP